MTKLYIGNIPFAATEAGLRDLFRPLHLDKVVLCTDRETGRPRGFGFVEIADRKAAMDAITDLNGADFGGRTIVVNEAIEKPREGGRSSPPPPPTTRSGGNRKPGSMDGWSGGGGK